MLASTIFNLIALRHYNYGGTEGMLLDTVSTGALSIISAFFIITSKPEFTATQKPNELAENAETEPRE